MILSPNKTPQPEQADLTFLQKNIVAVLRRHNGAMRHRDLKRCLTSWSYPCAEWQEAYQGLVAEKIIHEYYDVSLKKRGTMIAMVGLYPVDLPHYEVLPPTYPARRAQNKAWQAEGWQAFLDGVPRKGFPRVDKAYTVRWRNHRDNWQQGWDECEQIETRRIKSEAQED